MTTLYYREGHEMTLGTDAEDLILDNDFVGQERLMTIMEEEVFEIDNIDDLESHCREFGLNCDDYVSQN